MKYGETLRQRSIPAWSAYNIDYDDIKLFIKEHTTPGQGKSISVPGRGDDKLQQFQTDLFHILEEQHHRIDLFVKSKAREIQHRLDDAQKRLRILAARSSATDGRIPVRRLERYSKLESDVLKAGDEIKSLTRFTNTQRTAFRKLLKKYKKWTGSSQLEERFREQVLDDPKSFTKYDLGPLLAIYSDTLHNVRVLYESRVKQSGNGTERNDSANVVGSSVIARLNQSIISGSRAELDTAIATVPLGESATFAQYFVHPENVVELQVLLLQHLRYFLTRSRSNSLAAPTSPKGYNSQLPDFFCLAADSVDRFAKEQSALTVNDREHRSGFTSQKAKSVARWNAEDDAAVAVRTGEGRMKVVSMKRKHVGPFFDKQVPFPLRRGSTSVEGVFDELKAARVELEKDKSVRPLFQSSCSRSRFVGLSNSAEGVCLATLDMGISLQSPDTTPNTEISKSDFPFAVLSVRREGQTCKDLLFALDNSHLAERVPGFSLEQHAVWQICKPKDVPAPFWVAMLDSDIRKLPPPVMKLPPGSGNRSPSGLHESMSTTDSATAVETTRHSSLVTGGMETPPLQSFRKKRRRTYRESTVEEQPRYWNEFDHPEDGLENGDAYVIYIDPNEKSSFEIFFENIANLFSRRQRKTDEEDALLHSPRSPTDEESSDDEDFATANYRAQRKSYGTLPLLRTDTATLYNNDQPSGPFLPHFTTVCLVAAAALLVTAFILASTGKHKYAREVDFGVVFAIVVSLVFACIGVASLWRNKNVKWLGWAVTMGVVVADGVVSGGLLAWMLG